MIFSEEIIDRKFTSSVRVENKLLNTIDYVSSRDYALILRLKVSFSLLMFTERRKRKVYSTDRNE